MPDRDGVTLREGDPVLYMADEDTAVGATALAERQGNRYLIQTDPRSQPRVRPAGLPALSVALLDQVSAAVAEARSLGADTQEPFEVDGSELIFMGEWGDDDDDADDD